MNETRAVIPLEELTSHLVPSLGGFWEEKNVPVPEELPAKDPQEERFLRVPLALRLRREEGTVEITGCAHAVCRKSDHFVVEEGILLNHFGEFFGRNRELPLLRAKLLALALCSTKRISQVTVRLVLSAQGEVHFQEELCSREALEELFRSLAPTVFALAPLWVVPESKVEFPHTELRQGQKDLIHAVWNAVKNRHNLYACAPTGIGKTLAVLYPALKALETGKVSRVYYAAPKNPLKQQAVEAVETLQSVRGFRTLVLSAKMQLCPEKAEECKRSLCEYADAFYEKLPQALAFLTQFSRITETELTLAARRFTLCPFELARKVQEYCQIIIGDYNHIFDPEKAIFRPEKDHLLLVDEAHNLPQRIRENHTATLSPQDLDFFFRDDSHPSLMMREQFEELTGAFARLERARKESKTFHSFTLPEEAVKAARELLPKIAFALKEGFGTPEEEWLEHARALYQKCKRFVTLSRNYDERYATVFPPEGGVRLYLVDPRETIRQSAEAWRSAVFFSATLAPQSYYFDLLGGTENDVFLNLPSPFPRDNLFVGLVEIDVSFSHRFTTAPKICSIIRSAISAREGNYMVFLPSFEYLRLVSQEFKQQNFHTRILVQKKGMSRGEREEFLKAFRENRSGTLVGFCVMGGIFSEGIDLKGDSLSGEIIVGTGFPPPSPEAEAESEAYYKREMDGKAFAYTLPGWSRVLQAAGRVIRSEEDRGFLILCDARYASEDMRELFPDAWEDAEFLHRESELKEKLLRFWQ